MAAIDTASGGFLRAQAPRELSGNLSAYPGIYWDEFIQPRDFVTQATFIILEVGGILYNSKVPTGSDIVTDTWNSRFEPFVASAWMDSNDNSLPSFDNVDALLISMDTTLLNGIEARIDNFTVVPIPGAVVPIPGAVWLLGSGLIGLVVIRRKFRKG